MIKFLLLASLTVVTPALLVGCDNQGTQTQGGTQTETQGTGTLALLANGEDYALEGITSKDGWEISFNHIYVTLADVTAYQTDPPFDADADSEIQATEQVNLLEQPTTVDLVQGAEGNNPEISVNQTEAPAGEYNAMRWQMVQAQDGPAQGHTIVFDGTAQRDGETVNFVLRLNQPVEYVCGRYIGDERRGIVQEGDSAVLEATFHLDHIFGQGTRAADDPLNQGALGFDPIANLAQNGQVDVDMATLEQNLTPQDYQRLQTAVAELGHVGEGHCRVNEASV